VRLQKLIGSNILVQRKKVVSRDVKFEEDFASRKSHEPIPVIEDEEQEAPKVEPESPQSPSSGQQRSGEEDERVAPSSLSGDLDGSLKP
jgi:hypothetical protein